MHCARFPSGMKENARCKRREKSALTYFSYCYRRHGLDLFALSLHTYSFYAVVGLWDNCTNHCVSFPRTRSPSIGIIRSKSFLISYGTYSKNWKFSVEETPLFMAFFIFCFTFLLFKRWNFFTEKQNVPCVKSSHHFPKKYKGRIDKTGLHFRESTIRKHEIIKNRFSNIFGCGAICKKSIYILFLDHSLSGFRTQEATVQRDDCCSECVVWKVVPKWLHRVSKCLATWKGPNRGRGNRELERERERERELERGSQRTERKEDAWWREKKGLVADEQVYIKACKHIQRRKTAN